VGVPEASKGDSYLPTEKMVSPHEEVEVEEFTPKGLRLEGTLPQKKIPRRRGRPRKIKKVEENQNPIESCT
jgi:hypothetical protein